MKSTIARQCFITSVAVSALAMVIAVPAGMAGASSPRPTAPRSVHATALVNAARVSWTPPSLSGSSTVKGYLVTSHPLRHSCATAARSCVVKGLSSGSSYTFTVVAKNAWGSSPASATSNRVLITLSIKTAAAAYVAATTKWENSLVGAGTALNALNATSTQAQFNAAIASLKAAYSTFIATLAGDKWPAVAQPDMKSYVTAMTATETDTLALSKASSASTVPLYFANLDADSNLVYVGDAKIRTDLHLPQVINGPVASTSAPVAIGSPQIVHDFYDNTMTITVSSIIDPATAGNGSGLASAGFRFVAVQATLANTDPTNGEVDGNANLAMTVTGSDGVTYKADLGTTAQCTNFNDGEFHLPATDTSTGCVLFQLPVAVTITAVQFSLDAGYLDSVAWT